MPMRPCLAAMYATFSTDATRPCAEAVLMTRPQPASRMPGSSSRVVWKAAERLTAMMSSQRSTGNSSIGAVCWMPALLTRTSMHPKRSVASRASVSMAAGSRTSAPLNATSTS